MQHKLTQLKCRKRRISSILVFKCNILFIIVSFLLFSACSNPVSVASLPAGMEFVSIPQGSFQMGSPTNDPDSDADERPVHTVTFSYDFEIMATEVTQGMWEEVMGENPATGYGVGSDYPVYNVSWDDCQDFVDAMGNLDVSYTYRLPSEAEWEYCCRAGTTTRFYWGDDPNYNEISQYAWYHIYGDPCKTTKPVTELLPNTWNLYDMSGNVYEWCQDWYHDDYNGAPTNGNSWLSPTASYRVLRGGSWFSSASNCRSGMRSWGTPGYYGEQLGCRLVRIPR